HEDPVPLISYKAGQRVGYRRNIGQTGQPGLSGVRDRLHLAALDKSNHRGAVGEKELHLSRHDVIEGETAAAIGDVTEFDARPMGKHLQLKMLQRTVS